MYTGIGCSLGTDYFRIAGQLTGEELSYLRRTRDFVDDEVLPAINGCWERAEYPWPLIEKLAKLGVVGDGIDGYDYPPMSPIVAGLLHMEQRWLAGMAAPEKARRVRADRAHAWLGLSRAGNLVAPGRRRVGDRRARQEIPGGEGHTRLRREADRRQGVAARVWQAEITLSGVQVPEENR